MSYQGSSKREKSKLKRSNLEWGSDISMHLDQDDKILRTPYTQKVSKYQLDRQAVDFSKLKREKDKVRAQENHGSMIYQRMAEETQK